MSDERTVPYYCPYCGGEDLRPHGDVHGAWECRSCTRVFSVKPASLYEYLKDNTTVMNRAANRAVVVEIFGGGGGTI